MMTKEPAVPVSPRAPRKPSVCESCGAEFGCGAGAALCWCSELKLSDETLAELRTRFGGCLCRACLERFAADEQYRER
ncbi:MAG: cysteine-rich CWC family protein [Rubrivivax sp.]|nr:cysteine-rich CWC family protein [Pyrinomonadaceae bacterium]